MQGASKREEILKKLTASGPKVAPTLTKSGSDMIAESVETANNLKRSFVEWRNELAWQCGVFVFGERYLAKRFFQINYKFCSEDEAKEVVKDNLYAILRYKYFKKLNDEIDDRINDIVKNFTMNLATTLKRVSFDKDDDCTIAKRIPDYCIAFKNGVYNFRDEDWLFKYEVIELTELTNRMYVYEPNYIIQWYLNFDFEPLGINIMDTPLEEFYDLMVKTEEDYRWTGLDSPDYKYKNICFELMSNMAHDSLHLFSMDKFRHLCEVVGYVLNVSFLQYFVMLIGSGRNGKNSLFDGCFTHKVVPMPAQNSLIDIEENRFTSSTFENRFQNIYLETDEKGASTTSSQNIKNLTGSEQQMVEKKGVDKISTFINCKFIFSANEQEKLKFGDISDGFRRRINMYEVFYQFIADKEKLKRRAKTYYYTPFKQDLSDVKENLGNIMMFVYLGIYGIKEATAGFTKNFEFSRTDWSDTYSDIDFDLKDRVNAVSLTQTLRYINSNAQIYATSRKMFYDSGLKNEDLKPTMLFKSPTFEEFGFAQTYEGMLKMLKDPESASEYFAEYDIYMNMQDLQNIVGEVSTTTQSFNSIFKKLYPECRITKLNNKSYVLVNFDNDKLKIRKK